MGKKLLGPPIKFLWMEHHQLRVIHFRNAPGPYMGKIPLDKADVAMPRLLFLVAVPIDHAAAHFRWLRRERIVIRGPEDIADGPAGIGPQIRRQRVILLRGVAPRQRPSLRQIGRLQGPPASCDEPEAQAVPQTRQAAQKQRHPIRRDSSIDDRALDRDFLHGKEPRQARAAQGAAICREPAGITLRQSAPASIRSAPMVRAARPVRPSSAPESSLFPFFFFLS